jgi:hypothetical protein
LRQLFPPAYAEQLARIGGNKFYAAAVASAVFANTEKRKVMEEICRDLAQPIEFQIEGDLKSGP